MLLLAERLAFSYSADQSRLRATSEATRGTRDAAVRDVSLTVARGSITGLLGPNGCGKTTLLKLLAGIITPASGQVLFDGVAIASQPRRAVARRVAVVPQETHPAFDYTALEMVLMGRHPHLDTFQLEGPRDVALAYDALDATGTSHLADRPYMTLSGGEKQRVIIASALAQQPELLLLDEPTASLDLGYQLEIQALLISLNRERDVTMVLATHDLNLAASLCDHLVLMRSGQVLAQGATEDVLTVDAIRQVYGVTADVHRHLTTGHLTVVPLSRS
ncbi:MAG TPA: ABC transporter ATP-binding protein [Vicinamibacterales bacterium]|nr:ABC transporter ATP-binding protein [Vicinamibacterales bacterium]